MLNLISNAFLSNLKASLEIELMTDITITFPLSYKNTLKTEKEEHRLYLTFKTWQSC